jgi:hypothetical protein
MFVNFTPLFLNLTLHLYFPRPMWPTDQERGLRPLLYNMHLKLTSSNKPMAIKDVKAGKHYFMQYLLQHYRTEFKTSVILKVN